MTNASQISIGQRGAVSFAGPEAVSAYRIHLLITSLEMYAKFKMLPTRGVTPTRMLAMAAEITGKKYKRGAYLVAANDLREFKQKAIDNCEIIIQS